MAGTLPTISFVEFQEGRQEAGRQLLSRAAQADIQNSRVGFYFTAQEQQMSFRNPTENVSPAARHNSGALPEQGKQPQFGARKIFYLLDSLNVGGTETQAVELACRLSARGHCITLGCLQARGPLFERVNRFNVRVCEFRPRGGIDSPGGFYQLLRLTAFLRREQFDVVHTHDLWSNLLGVPAAWLARVPAIISSRRDLSHFDWYQSWRRSWLRRIQNLSNVVLTNATPIRDSLIAEDEFAPEKLRVVHNGIDINRFRHELANRERLFPGVGDGKLVVP